MSSSSCSSDWFSKDKDLYSVNDFESSTNNELAEAETTDVMKFQELAPYLEPLYEIFFCPLTNKMMKDPVTIETGVTYERAAITEWYEKFGDPADIICPKTSRKITSRVLNSNSALMETIKQWEKRNEQARIRSASSALSLASNKTMIIEALHNLQSLCREKEYNVVEIRTMGVVSLLGTFLARKDTELTFETLELLRHLAENEEGKEMIARTMNLSAIIQNLSSTVERIKHSALLLLVDLSKSVYFCDKIGSVTGGVLMLITLKYRHSVDAFASEKAGEILKNLERSPSNIKCMAENGHWQPLLHHFLEGIQPSLQVYNRNFNPFCQSALIQMVFHGNSLARDVAFRALKQISSHKENGKILVTAGAVSSMLHEMFKRTIYDEPMNSKAEAAAILANILESGSVELNDLQVNHNMSLDYIIYNIVKKVGNSTPDELNICVLRILLCLMKFTKTSAIIVSVVKESDACTNLIELVNNPNEELRVSSIVFATALSPFLGHTLAERLCKTRGQPQALLEELLETTPLTEKQAVSANFFAKLPHENVTLNVALLNIDTIPSILRRICQVLKSGMRMSKYASAYLEGLVGILVRFTATLYEHQILVLAQICKFTTLFTELLVNTSSDEVQRLSAIGLKNLSSKTVTLSKPAQIKNPSFRKFSYIRKCFSSDPEKHESIPLCPVHKGSCSSQETFCLVEAKAVQNLLACFEHKNIQVVEAALSAICTLLDEKVDLSTSVGMLIQEKAIQHVLNVIKEHKDESLRQKSFWMLEKLHDRALMQYADKLEASGKCLAELLNLGTTDLSDQFGMKRGHMARFMDRTSQCEADPMPASFSLPSRKSMAPPSRNSTTFKTPSMSDEPRGCGCIQPPPVVDDVAPYSTIENISVQKLTPEYKIGMERLVKLKTPPMRASDLWRDKPALLLCIRRPGCIMCRAEAHKLYSKKPIFDALGINMFAILHEHIESEVRDFWPRYWGGVVLLDKNMDFFKALGGGSLLKDKFISGFLFNPRARANYKRAKAMGIEQNFKGEGEIKGGLFIVGKGRSGVAYQFIERNFGDWAPLAEVIEVATRLQSHLQNGDESMGGSRDYE